MDPNKNIVPLGTDPNRAPGMLRKKILDMICISDTTAVMPEDVLKVIGELKGKEPTPKTPGRFWIQKHYDIRTDQYVSFFQWIDLHNKKHTRELIVFDWQKLMGIS